MKKKGFFLFILVLLLILFSNNQLKFKALFAVGNYLIAEDSLKKADAIFVLSGRPFERGMAAMDIFFEGYADKIICMGSVVPQDLKSLGFNYKESELIQHFLSYRMQIPKKHIDILPIGSSTFEESEAILEYAQNHNFNTVIIVSSAFHTRRIRLTFKDKFEAAGIETIIRGHIRKPEPNYWWQSEHGLINVNNEYIKILYYWLKY